MSRTSVTGIPLANNVTIGALRRVATVVSPKRTAAQPLPAAATGCWPAYPAADTSAVVTIAPLNHRFMREEVRFGAALCKESSDITVSSLSGSAILRACFRGPCAVSKLAIPHAGAAAAVVRQRPLRCRCLRNRTEHRFSLRRLNRR